MPRPSVQKQQQVSHRPPPDSAPERIKYGAIWPPTWHRSSTKNEPVVSSMEDWEIELCCCQMATDGIGPPTTKAIRNCPGHKGFRFHFYRLIDAFFGMPESQWPITRNPNLELIVDRFLEHRRLAVMGHAGSGKTHSMAVIALLVFLIYGKNCKIFVTSTTLQAAKGKIWGEIVNGWQWLVQFMGGEDHLPGRYLKSEYAIYYNLHGLDDTTAGIHLVATEVSSDDDTAKKVKGAKAPVLIMLADELDTLKENLMVAVKGNLSTNDGSRFVGTFNPKSRFTIEGRFATPAEGWNTVNEDGPLEWKTETGWCVRFDALKSANVLAGRTIYPGLLSPMGLENLIADNKGTNTPEFWRNGRGWFAPMGLAATVCDETEIAQHGATEHENLWVGPPMLIGGLDTANTAGGDKNVFTIAKMGEAQRIGKDGQAVNVKVCDIIDQRIILHDARSREAPEEQVVKRVKEIMEEAQYSQCVNGGTTTSLGCYPLRIENVAIDRTGGSNVLPLIRRDLGAVREVSFKESPSERTISPTDRKKGVDAFVNKRAEMWCIRHLIQGGHIRGLPAEVAKQLCEALVVDKAGKKQVEDKKELKKRLTYSPDEADSAVLCIDVARVKFGLTSSDKVKRNARPGYRLERKMGIDGKPYEIEIPLMSQDDYQSIERFMSPEDRKNAQRIYPAARQPNKAALLIEYEGAGTWENNY